MSSPEPPLAKPIIDQPPQPRIIEREALRSLGIIPPNIPDQVVDRLVGVCVRWNLALTQELTEAYILRIPRMPAPRCAEDYHYQIRVPISVFFRQIRATRLWLPGASTCAGSGDEQVATATCHTRTDPSSATWLTVGVQARRFVYYERDSDGRTPTRPWMHTGDLMLMRAAEILAARKALGPLVDDFETECGQMEVGSDVRVRTDMPPPGPPGVSRN